MAKEYFPQEKAYKVEFLEKEKERRTFGIDQALKEIDGEINEREGRDRKIRERLKRYLEKAKEEIEREFSQEKERLSQELDPELLSRILEEGKKEFLEKAKNFLENKKEISLLEGLINFERFRSDLDSITKRKIIEDCQNQLQNLEKANQEIESSSLEGFLAVNLLEIRNLRRQLEKGIVETPSVREKINEIKEYLLRGQIPFVYGETGIGKSAAAIKIAKELSGKEPEIIPGSEKTTYEELVGFLGLTVGKELRAEEFYQLFKEEIESFRKKNPNAPEDLEKLINDFLVSRFSQKPTITEFQKSRTFEALNEGRMVIIDEANMIPSGILAAYNRVFDEVRRKGIIEVPLTGEKINLKEKAKEGFPSFILTGNITTASTNRYKRFILEPTLRDRIVLIEYPTPDQETDPSKKHTDQEIPRDLYTIGMISLLDKKGVLRAPEDAPDKVWRLAQAFKVFQNAFAGKAPLEIKGQAGASANVWPEKNHASMRKFLDILESWQKDGYQYEIDSYIWKYLIQPSLDTPQEAVTFYQILQANYDFFQKNWPSAVPKIIDGQVKSFELQPPSKEQQKSEEKIVSFDFQTLIENLTGKKADRLITQEGKEAAEKRAQIEFVTNIEVSLASQEEFLKEEAEKLKEAYQAQTKEELKKPQSSYKILAQRLEEIREKARELVSLKEEFFKTGNKKIIDALNKKREEIERLNQAYLDFAYPEYEKGARIFLLEKEEIKRLKEVISNLEIEGKHLKSLKFEKKNLSFYFKKNPRFLRKFVRLKEIDLAGCDLPSLSSDQLPESIEKIDLFNNEGIQINLKNSPQLKEINLAGCDLPSLSSDQLPKSIEKIDLFNNEGIQINLKDFPQLKEIDLRFCNLSPLFSDQLPESIEKIDVGGNKGIQINLKDFPQLKEIGLIFCYLPFLSSDQLPPSIEEIVAKGNFGIQIDLKNSPRLKKINLSYCYLPFLSSDQLPPSIEEIDVELNEGIKIDPEIRVGSKKFPNLKEIKT